ncbi:MAG: transglycosylase SLT domain-containing protein, partial [Muribaculaceae bacterium]|nr:transglycosylase SLT domain-containing protein [Muribaculaceae bacterium]
DDTLRVGTLYSPSSFFIYRGDTLGYDYELACRFAADMGRPVSFTVGRSLVQLTDMALDGTIDLIAYEVPVTAEYAEHLIPCGYENITTQVLVQPASGDSVITDVTQLVGRTVYVEAGSKYYYRMVNLNRELGGGIDIVPVESDTIVTEDLIDMVAGGKLPLTVADSDVAQLNGTYYAGLDYTVALSMEQRAAWAVVPSQKKLAETIDEWMKREEPAAAQKELLKQYFQLAKIAGNPYTNIDFTDGTISKYDNIFRRYAPTIGWDWRMLAAQAYTESRFNPRARSFAGARGLMQIMPRTGRAYGLRNANDPEQSVRAAVSLLADLDRQFQPIVPDNEERIKFVLASYNGGIG